MDDHVGLRLGDGGADGRPVEAVEDDGPGARPAEQLRLVGRARRAGDRMAVFEQCGNECAADRAGRACEEDVHVRADETAGPGVTGAEELRPLLFSIAYRMLASDTDSSASTSAGASASASGSGSHDPT